MNNDRYWLLWSIAKQYAGPNYQIDELINEAWLARRVRKEVDTGRFWQTAKWVMLDYIREQERTDTKRWKCHLQIKALPDDDVGPGVVDFNQVEYNDWTTWLYNRLTNRQRMVVEMRLNGCKWPEIAEAVGGISGQRVYQVYREALDVLRGVLVDDVNI